MHLFHCVEIADGTRTIDVGADVEFDVLVKFGRRRGRQPAPAIATVTELEQRIVDVIVALGEGEVVSYGDVADDAGFPGRSRAVGSLLAGTDLDLPWWRVVRSDGRLATDPAAGQAALLRAEGVTVRDGRVVDAPIGRFRRRDRCDRVKATDAASPGAGFDVARVSSGSPARRSATRALDLDEGQADVGRARRAS